LTGLDVLLAGREEFLPDLPFSSNTAKSSLLFFLFDSQSLLAFVRYQDF